MVVVATGFFDGVHIGHRFLVESLVSSARSRGGQSLVVTFWPHPRTVLQNGARGLRLLSTLQEKKDLLKSLGVDRIEVLDFTREFGSLTAEEYLREIVIRRFGGTAILLGYDNRMGSDGLTTPQIKTLAQSLGLEVIEPGVMPLGDTVVSSTKIRNLLSAGDVESASAMLGCRYSLHGVVVEGDRIGRTLGFPTANMQLYEPLKQVPGRGVYLVGVTTLGRNYMGMCNIGCRPTVRQNGSVTIETNIFDFDEDIYGLDMVLTFHAKIRDEQRFPDLESLRAQLALDREKCLKMI